MRPDYPGGSLVNLVASLVAARGGVPRHPMLSHDELASARDATNLVFLIVDGLGDNYLRRRGAGGELERRRKRAITSVFPSTTASAITTSYTGETPLEHGLTGWFVYFGEAGCVSAALPFRSRGDMTPLAERGVQPERVFVSRTIFQAMPVRSIVVTARDIIDSAYNTVHCAGAERWAYETAHEFISSIEKAVKSDARRKFIYAYWPHYDRVAHHHGCDSAEAARELQIIDAAFGRLCQSLSGTGTFVVVTADHGFIDVAPEQALELPPMLAPELRFPLCGERRVAYCHVRDAESFARKAKAWLEDRADVMPSRELVAQGWLGPGTPHARLGERVGDVTIVMRDRYTLKDWTPGEPRWLHIGNHGGTHEDEMMIPLIVESA